MKNRNLLSGFCLAVLMTLGLRAGTAHAQAQPQCGDSNINYTGNLVLAPQSGQTDCHIGGFIVATGSVQISAPNGTVSVDTSVQAGTFLQITALNDITIGSFTATVDAVILKSTSGNISTTSIQSSANDGYVDVRGKKITTTSISTMNAAVSLLSQGDIQTTNVVTNGGAIQFHANYQTAPGSGSDPLVTNAGAANGPNGYLSSQNSSGSGGGIYLTNGGSGGITITNATDLGSSGSTGSGGGIVVDACNEQDTGTACAATLTLPGSGTISSDGSNAGAAGIQLYIAKSITVKAGTLAMSASDTYSSGSHPEHYVVLATNTLTLTGNLSIYANGDQPASPAQNAASEINNFGGSTASDGFTPFTAVTTTLTTSPASSGLTISGSGALQITAQGKNPFIGIQGMPVNYSAGALTIYTYDPKAIIELSSPTGSPINFTSAAAVGLYANGMTGANSAGGTIDFFPGKMGTMTPKFSLFADGTGTGLSGHVNVQPQSGNISLGSNAGSILIAADGGSTNQCKAPVLPSVNVATTGIITFDASEQPPAD